MSTINQDEILNNLRKLANTAEAFSQNSSEIKSAITTETDVITNLIRAIHKALSENIEKNFSEFEKENKQILSDLSTEISQISIKVKDLQEGLGDFNEKAIGLKTRLDQFGAQVEFLEKNVSSLATERHVKDTVSKEIATQTVLLTKELASKELLEKLEKRINGEDGEGGLVGRVTKLNSSLITNINQIKIELETVIRNNQTELNQRIGDSAQKTGLIGQLDDLKTNLAGKTTSQEFWKGIIITISLAIFGAAASSSWIMTLQINPIQKQIDTIGNDLDKIGNTQKTILENIEKLEKRIPK